MENRFQNFGSGIVSFEYFRIYEYTKEAFLLVEKNGPIRARTNTRAISDFHTHPFRIENKLNYFKLQDEQWSYYYHLGITEGIWNGRVSKKMALINSMCYTYGRQKTLIDQRRKYFKQQLQDITTKLHEHLQQVPSMMDPNQLMMIAHDIVDKDQYQLHVEFERRKHILKFDAKDHQLVETFYQLKPRQTEVRENHSN